MQTSDDLYGDLEVAGSVKLEADDEENEDGEIVAGPSVSSVSLSAESSAPPAHLMKLECFLDDIEKNDPDIAASLKEVTNRLTQEMAIKLECSDKQLERSKQKTDRLPALEKLVEKRNEIVNQQKRGSKKSISINSKKRDLSATPDATVFAEHNSRFRLKTAGSVDRKEESDRSVSRCPPILQHAVITANPNPIGDLNYVGGPLTLLREAIVNGWMVRVHVRSRAKLRSIVTARVHAFDRHWNVALTHVHELYFRPKRARVFRKTNPQAQTVDHERQLDARLPQLYKHRSLDKKRYNNIEVMERSLSKLMVFGDQIIMIQVVREPVANDFNRSR